MPEAKLNDPQFWLDAWNGALRRSVNARSRGATANIDYWDGLAGLLVQWSKQGRARRRVELIMEWLEREGALGLGVEMLDIGAGTGDFAISMAQRGARVTALEPAAAVMAALQRRAGEAQVEIRFLQQEWEQADPVRDGLAHGFDLVFASLCPAVR